MSCSAFAASLLTFDKYNFSVVRDKKDISGYYVGQSHKSNKSKDETIPRDCIFIFKKMHGEWPITIWVVPQPVERWDLSPYTEGRIHIDDNLWTINLSDRPNNCASKPDGDQFLTPVLSPKDLINPFPSNQENSGAKFTVTRSTPAIGIRWTTEAATIFHFVNRIFNETNTSLPVAQPVTLIKMRGKFSLVRHVNPANGEITNVWVKTSTLVNPFPRN